MIKLSLTGANPNNKELHKSLGGVISNFPLRNGVLFSDISKADLQTKGREIRVIALTNTSEVDIPTFSVYYDIESVVNGVEVKVGGQYFDDAGNVELLTNDNEIPFNVTFVDATGVANAVELSEGLLAGQSISLWFQRTSPKIEDDCELEDRELENKVTIFIDY